MRIAIYHNVLGTKYKGAVFSQLYRRSRATGVEASFVQIAETEDARLGFGKVESDYHQYPFRLLFRGNYDSASLTGRIVALVKDVWKHPCDLLIMPGYSRIEYWAMLAACMLRRQKRAVFCDSTPADRPKAAWKNAAKRLFFSRCDGFFCYGIRSKQFLLSYGVSESKINFRCQAAALPLDYDPAAVLLHYEAGNLPEAPTFVYIGRLSAEKGLLDFFAAFAALRRTIPTARMSVIGTGPQQAELVQRALDLNIEAAISFHGRKTIDEFGPLLLQSSALVLPSHSEPWGLTVNESLSYGCPVIVSDVCGCVPDLVLRAETGFSFPAGDIEALAAAMQAVLRLPRLDVARRCLDVISRFTPDRAAMQILDGCARLVGGL